MGAPAARAVALGADGGALPGVEPGLRPGDEIISVAGRRPDNFSDVVVAAAMAKRDRPVDIVVRREGVAEPLRFQVVPEAGTTGLLELGIAPPVSTTLEDPRSARARAQVVRGLELEGLVGVEPGMRLTRVGTLEGPARLHEAERVFEGSAGASVPVVFEGASGQRVAMDLAPRPQTQVGVVRVGGEARAVAHLLGLAGVMRVDPRMADVPPQGFEAGDIFARIGEVEYPTLAAGVAEILAHAGRWAEVEVLRDPDADGEFRRVSLRVKVKGNGTIGLGPTDTLAGGPGAATGSAVRSGVLVAAVPARMTGAVDSAEELDLAARDLIDGPGQLITHVNGRGVSSLAELRGALVDATRDAAASGGGASVPVRIELPLTAPGSARAAAVERVWELAASDVRELHALGWEMPVSPVVFAMEQVVDRSSGPLAAVGRGLAHTRRVMAQTYLTFARLFEGTVKVEHLKGPVGIAHIGTRIADRGVIWLLFFMALISVNLAVINFLPLPIVDGGQFVMLVYEWVRGRPVPAGVQNALTLAGLAMIGGLFLIVTFHDLKALLGV
jgi:regulator of sigma E protease